VSNPNIISATEAGVNKQDISSNALQVVNDLQEAGFQAYLVGGCVRDLLLNLKPKDFDVATDAKPEEIANIFKNCRIIGRRFKLAHIRFGYEVIDGIMSMAVLTKMLYAETFAPTPYITTQLPMKF